MATLMKHNLSRDWRYKRGSYVHTCVTGWIVSPNKYVEMLTTWYLWMWPCLKIRSLLNLSNEDKVIRTGPNTIWRCPLRTEGNDKRARMSCNNGSRDWDVAAASQGLQQLLTNHWKLRKGKERFSPTGFRGILCLLTPWFWTLASSTMRQKIFVVVSYQFVVLCYVSPKKLMYWEKIPVD